MKNINKIAHQGSVYTIEWYFNNNEKSDALNYFNQLTTPRQAKLMKLVTTMGEVGKIRDITKFRHEGNGIYVFKPQPDRFFCFFFKGGKIIITNAYEKKTDKMPSRDYAKALLAQEDYENRCKHGEYYEENK
jgi:phage-related protein